MESKTYLFTAQPLGRSKVSENSDELKQFTDHLINKIGCIKNAKLKLYRVPTSEPNTQHQKYVIISFTGELSDCLVELSCNENFKSTKWPSIQDIELGKRLSIVMVDWIDVLLLTHHLASFTQDKELL